MTAALIDASRVLHSESEISAAKLESERLGLCPCPDPTKYWDNLLSVRAIEAAGVGPSDPIVDLGCRSGILLTWLHQRGYRSLHGCDIRAPLPPLRVAAQMGLWRTVVAGISMYSRNATRMRRAPVERTGFPSSHFAAATCMSVVEHGVDISAFVHEAARILRPGGLLLVSTDYWPDKIDVGSLRRFEEARGNDRIFDRAELGALRDQAAQAGMRLEGVTDFAADEAPIVFDGLRYTFAFLAFRR